MVLLSASSAASIKNNKFIGENLSSVCQKFNSETYILIKSQNLKLVKIKIKLRS